MPRREMLKIDFPLYSIFGGAAYDFSTIKNGELFLYSEHKPVKMSFVLI